MRRGKCYGCGLFSAAPYTSYYKQSIDAIENLWTRQENVPKYVLGRLILDRPLSL